MKKAHKSVLALCCDKITKDSPNEYKISKNAFISLLYLFEFAYNNSKPTTVTEGLREIVALLGCKTTDHLNGMKEEV